MFVKVNMVRFVGPEICFEFEGCNPFAIFFKCYQRVNVTPLVQLKEPLKANVYVGPILLGHSATNVTKDTKAVLVINVNLDTI